MKQTRTLLLAFFILISALVLFDSCKKSTDYLPAPYVCNCGSFNWMGTTYSLKNTSYILTDSTVALSRRYYITGDVKLAGEDSTHALSMTLEIDNVSGMIFQKNANNDQFDALVDELNVNDIILSGRHFVATQGTVQVNPAVFGGTESVTFNMILKEIIDNTLVGIDVPFTGNFKVQITV